MGNDIFKYGSGPLLTSKQIRLLELAVDVEGHIKERSNIIDKSLLEKYNLYKDILLNILFLGHGYYIGKYNEKNSNSDFLKTNQIIEELDDSEINNEKYEIVKKAYKLAFNGYRKLDSSPFTAPIISYEERILKNVRPSLKEKLKIEKWIDDIEYGEKILFEYIVPIIDNLSELFGYYFDQNINFYKETFEKYYDFKNVNKNTKTTYTINIYKIFNAMGLKLLSAEEYDKSRIPFDLSDLSSGISFYPFNLDNLLKVNDMSNFDDYCSKSLDLMAVDDLNIHYYINSFWRTVFEFQNIIELSAKKQFPLIITEDIIPKNDIVINTKKDELILFKIYLSKRICVPRINSLEDLIRLREDKRISPLKEVLQEWTTKYNNNNKNLNKIIERINKDMILAEKDIKKLDKIRQISGIVGFICIPVGAVELLTGTPISVITGATAGIINYFAWEKNKKNQWIYWGL